MAKDYGDIPTMVESGVRHITKSATECLCGYKWRYGVINRAGRSTNIAWRTLEKVNCERCKEIYIKENSDI